MYSSKNSKIWNSIKTLALLQNEKVFHTTLLGVPPRISVGEFDQAKFEPKIPEGLAEEARKNGFEVIAATFNGYKLKLK